MQKSTLFYLYREDGKRLTENGKDAGVLVIAAIHNILPYMIHGSTSPVS